MGRASDSSIESAGRDDVVYKDSQGRDRMTRQTCYHLSRPWVYDLVVHVYHFVCGHSRVHFSLDLTPTRPSETVAGQLLVCETEDHVTLSRRCSTWVRSPAPVCLLKVVALRTRLRTTSSSYLLHKGPVKGCSRTGHTNYKWTGLSQMRGSIEPTIRFI